MPRKIDPYGAVPTLCFGKKIALNRPPASVMVLTRIRRHAYTAETTIDVQVGLAVVELSRWGS
jgi:hypothetical protein